MVSEKRGGASKYWAAAALAASSCILDLNPQPEEPETDGNDEAPAETVGRGGATQKRNTDVNHVIDIPSGRGGAFGASTAVVYSSGGTNATSVGNSTVTKGASSGDASDDISAEQPNGGSMGAGGASETSSTGTTTETGNAAMGSGGSATTGIPAFGSGGSKSNTGMSTGGRKNTEVGGGTIGKGGKEGTAATSLPPSAAGQGALGGGGLAGQSAREAPTGASGLTLAGKQSR